MKIHRKTSANKLLIRFDNELKTILVNDLNNIRNIKHQFSHGNHQARLQVS